MPLFRVRDILQVIAPHVRGTGVDIACDPDATREALAAYNRCNELMMNRHDWPGTEANVRFPIHSGVLTLPERFAKIKSICIDGRPSGVFPAGWQYLESGPGDHMASGWPVNGLQHLGDYFPVYRFLPKPLPLFAFSSEDEDKRAAILITGYDLNNREQHIAIPIAKATPTKRPRLSPVFSSIAAVSKPITNGYVDLGAWDNEKGPFWLSRLDCGDQSPCYTRYLLPGLPSEVHEISACVSLRFRDLHRLDDVSLIQHREAYRFACQAITAFDDSNTQLGSEFMGRALALLKGMVAKGEEGQRRAINVSSTRTLTRKRTTRY